MGWSCAVEASKTMCRIQAHAGLAGDGCWRAGGNRYFIEVSRREHRDGAITGQVWRCLGPDNPDGSGRARKAGSFRIEPDGTVSRGPRHLRDLAVMPLPAGWCGTCGDRTDSVQHVLCWACAARADMAAHACRPGSHRDVTALPDGSRHCGACRIRWYENAGHDHEGGHHA